MINAKKMYDLRYSDKERNLQVETEIVSIVCTTTVLLVYKVPID